MGWRPPPFEGTSPRPDLMDARGYRTGPERTLGPRGRTEAHRPRPPTRPMRSPSGTRSRSPQAHELLRLKAPWFARSKGSRSITDRCSSTRASKKSTGCLLVVTSLARVPYLLWHVRCLRHTPSRADSGQRVPHRARKYRAVLPPGGGGVLRCAASPSAPTLCVAG
jgi:hypothetical protein